VIIGILKCDSVSEQFVADHGQYPEMFAKLLLPVEPSLQFVTFDAENSELPSDIHAADAYLITGSRRGVNDGYPWIEALISFVVKLHEAQKKIVGICFGHQLIAKALGGQVIKSPKGWGVGMSKNDVRQQKGWMQPYQAQLNILVSHQDQVVELPQEAEVLASSDFCPNYMMQIKSNVLSIQGHPEFSKGYSKDLLDSREDRVGPVLYNQAINSLVLPVDDHLVAQWIVNFIKE